MELIWNKSANAFEAITTFDEREIPKAAGFRWNGDAKRWRTTDGLVAHSLRHYAAEDIHSLIDQMAEAARAAKASAAQGAVAAIAASRATDANIEIPCAEGRAFLPYQRAGIAFALEHPSVLIGDDMGLGKTAQAIGVINVDQELKRILIVCPASLTRNWQREIGFFGSRDLTVGIATTKAVPTTDIVICTYDTFSRSTAAAAEIQAITWDALILDEAHYLKNDQSKRTKAILGDGKDIKGLRVRKRRMYLTGTPVTNRPIELWPLISSLDPQFAKSRFKFAERYCDAKIGSGGFWDFSGSSNLTELQDKLRTRVMVRRMKADVLTELPPKRRQIIDVPADTPELRAVLKLEEAASARHEQVQAELKALRKQASVMDRDTYAAAVATLRERVQIAFAEMSKVRHETAIAKAPLVAQHIKDVLEGGVEKVIVFAHHVDVVDLLRTELADQGVVSITGSTPTHQRQAIVDRFQTDPAVRVFLGNIQAAGTGLTLTAASHVIFAELDWVPGNVSQAEDRAHRLGQRNAVLVQHLVLDGSLDAKMARTLIEKQFVIDAALDNPEAAGTREDRIAAAQAQLDAEQEDALEAAEASAAAQKAAREAWEQQKIVRRAAAVERAELWKKERAERHARAVADAAQGTEQVIVSADARIAILEGLRLLVADDADRAAERNGVGFGAADTWMGHHLARMLELSDDAARVGRALVQRYRRQLPEDVVARALLQDQPTEILVAAPAANDDQVIEGSDVVTPIKRGRGRPPKSGKAMTGTERQRAYRKAHAMSDVSLPGDVAERLRVMAEASGMTQIELVAAALDALEAAQKSQAA